MKPHIVSTPMKLAGRDVRLVAWDWRSDKDYADPGDAVDARQVTWSNDDREPEAGWIADVEQHADGSWWIGDDGTAGYATAEDAAVMAVLEWMAYEKTLSDEDYERLAERIVPILAMPGARPPPSRQLNTLKTRCLR